MRDNGRGLRYAAGFALLGALAAVLLFWNIGAGSVDFTPAEIVDGTVTTRDGRNVDAAFRKGAALALARAREEGAELAILQPRSPSCGAREVYDGTFSGRKVRGQGVFAQLLAESGFRVLEPEDLEG